MRKLLQLSLLLSSLLMLCSQSVDVAGEINVWNIGHILEESFNDSDNHDLDETLSKTVLFTASSSLKQQLFFFESNRSKISLTYGFIRAPPQNII